MLAVIDPRSGRYSAGAIEGALLGAAVTEMGRYYGLPVEASGMGTDHHIPSIQAGYERAMGGMLPTLSWPDLLVGPGLLGGSMILSLEQLLIDTEVFRYYRRAWQGIDSSEDRWLEEVIGRAGPGGEFLSERSTVAGMRGGEWYVSRLGLHDTYEGWVAAGQPTLLEEATEKVRQILSSHESLPWGAEVERELERIQERAEMEE